jgi:hypothetical protein
VRFGNAGHRGEGQRGTDFAQPSLRWRTANVFPGRLGSAGRKPRAFAGYDNLRSIFSCACRNVHGAARPQVLQFISNKSGNGLRAVLPIQVGYRNRTYRLRFESDAPVPGSASTALCAFSGQPGNVSGFQPEMELARFHQVKFQHAFNELKGEFGRRFD